jgi:translocation and assembly module TamA
VCAGHAAAARIDYRVEIEAPRELKTTLERGLNVVRWRDDPEMDADRLKRLVDEAVRESREAAATEGYFSAEVRAEIDSSVAPWVVRLRLDPEQRTRVRDVELRFLGPAATDAQARALLEKVRASWTLKRGEPFRQADWEAAKRQALRDFSSWRYAAASIADSRAVIDPEERSASLTVEMESGPPFRFGELRVTGTRRFSDALVANLSAIRPGEVYDRERVILLQRRLLESGYFASVQAEIDAQPAAAEAAPLRVAVIEAPQHHVESGLSYNTDVGVRFETRYSNEDVLGSAWRFRTGLNLDKQIQSLTFDVDAPPRPGGQWNSYMARARQEDIQNQETREVAFGVSHNWGAGLAPSALIVSAHFEESVIAGQSPDDLHALYLGGRKTFRRTDDLVSPRRGYVLTGEVGGGPTGLATEPFMRAVASALVFFPFGQNGDMLLRGQAGAVLSHAREGIPSTFLFRTGGDQTVRGYAFESLGVAKDGAIVGGRRLVVASAEYVHWFGESWGVAVFADTGNAWDSGVRPSLANGYGFGARFRTPIGPIRADLAYGQATGDVRLHFSVGYSF